MAPTAHVAAAYLAVTIMHFISSEMVHLIETI
jgi:hypothetical protein